MTFTVSFFAPVPVLMLLALVLLFSQPHPTEAADPTCRHGVQAGPVCCPRSCGTCGGNKCRERSVAVNDLCCGGAIAASDRNCLTADAPCSMTRPKNYAAGSIRADPLCRNGLRAGGVCCPAECSSCGGDDCVSRGELISSRCCVGEIKILKEDCREVGAPCVMKKVVPARRGTCTDIRGPFGCFCYLAITGGLPVRKSTSFEYMCESVFGRRAIRRTKKRCVRYNNRRVLIGSLLRKVNRLLPRCYPQAPAARLNRSLAR